MKFIFKLQNYIFHSFVIFLQRSRKYFQSLILLHQNFSLKHDFNRFKFKLVSIIILIFSLLMVSSIINRFKDDFIFNITRTTENKSRRSSSSFGFPSFSSFYNNFFENVYLLDILYIALFLSSFFLFILFVETKMDFDSGCFFSKP